MKYVGMLCAVAMALAVTPMMVSGADDEVTLSGEPVDINCFLTGKSGEGHASCAMSCAERGNPIGLFVKDGDKEELYLVIGGGGKSAKDAIAEHMGKQVKATGKVTNKGGMKVIEVSKVEA